MLGAPTLLSIVVASCIEGGARMANAGEFTARAFLSGRLDLTQAHGVAGMIAARTDSQLRAAERLLHGQLGAVAMDAREDLADLLSLVEGAMDFADEPIEFIDVDTLRNRLSGIRERLAATAEAGIRAERWGLLPSVVLVGRANAGKSSLLNRLCGVDRAISTPIAGTTRDALSAAVSLGETTCLLVDVAGAMETLEGESPGDSSIDALARQMATRAEQSAELVVIVLDVSTESAFDDAIAQWRKGSAPRLIVANKTDAASAERMTAFDAWSRIQPELPSVSVSARTGAGCEALKALIASMLSDRVSSESDAAIALMAEHREALSRALEAMDRALTVANDCDAQLQNADLAATEMRIAAEALGMLVGMDQTEEMLGRIFSRFCVGK